MHQNQSIVASGCFFFNENQSSPSFLFLIIYIFLNLSSVVSDDERTLHLCACIFFFNAKETALKDQERDQLAFGMFLINVFSSSETLCAICCHSSVAMLEKRSLST